MAPDGIFIHPLTDQSQTFIMRTLGIVHLYAKEPKDYLVLSCLEHEKAQWQWNPLWKRRYISRAYCKNVSIIYNVIMLENINKTLTKNIAFRQKQKNSQMWRHDNDLAYRQITSPTLNFNSQLACLVMLLYTSPNETNLGFLHMQFFRPNRI